LTAAGDLATRVGVSGACGALGVPRSTFYRRIRGVEVPPPSPGRATPPRALSPYELDNVLSVLHLERFWDSSPASVYYTLLDEDRYICSERTMYRILAAQGEAKERRKHRSRSGYTKPELLATASNEIWSWDITKLRGPVKWTYFYLYVILDIFSRYVTSWMVAHREAAVLAERLIKEACRKQGIEPWQLTLHADRGPSMKSKTVAQLLDDLKVNKTHSRPHTSNDNPYSEAQFKTVKYNPEFPERFGCIEDARSFCGPFFNWYNTCHRHSGIAYLTPEAVHYGHAEEIIKKREVVLLDAFAAHPERFVNKVPQPPTLSGAVWINPAKPSLAVDGKGVVLP
jgi:putative transposase